MPKYDEIINDVEQGILDLIEEKLAGIFNLRSFGVEVEIGRVNQFPAALVSTDRLMFKSITQNAYAVRPRTHIYMLFRSDNAVDKEKLKRHGLYPIVIGVARLLSGRDFDLDITPLNPESATEVISAELAERSIIMFDLAMGWDFEIEERDFDEEEAAALVAIANKWLLGNHEAVEDTVNV